MEQWFGDIETLQSNNSITDFIIDEVGHLELKGKGFYNLIVSVLKKGQLFKNIYLVVRKTLVESVTFNFNISNYTLIDVEQRR